MGYRRVVCQRCGAEFAVWQNVAWKAKHCPDCREAANKERAREQNKKRRAKRAAEGKPMKYSNLDEHIRALHAAGTTYAEEQKRDTVEKYARINLTVERGS